MVPLPHLKTLACPPFCALLSARRECRRFFKRGTAAGAMRREAHSQAASYDSTAAPENFGLRAPACAQSILSKQVAQRAAKRPRMGPKRCKMLQKGYKFEPTIVQKGTHSARKVRPPLRLRFLNTFKRSHNIIFCSICSYFFR